MAFAVASYLKYDVGQMKTLPAVGQFEQLVMTAILKCADNAYGVTIHETVEELSRPKSVALGAVYTTLDRLEEKASSHRGCRIPHPNVAVARSATTGSRRMACEACASRR